MRTRPGWIEPEVYFRIVHVAQNGHNGAPVATCREQTVEIVWGGGLRKRQRWHPDAPDPHRPGRERRLPKPEHFQATQRAQDAPGGQAPPQGPIEWQALLESGRIANQAEIARREGISPARVTQVMGMLHLAPEIQEQILSMPDMARRPPISERMLRPIEIITDRYSRRRD